jgi:hypothetical protein
LKVRDRGASVRFHSAALAALGHVLSSDDASGAGFGPPGEPALWLCPAKGATGPGMHVAFRAGDHKAVDIHAEGLKGGARDHRRPGLRTDCGPSYYAVFLFDPVGSNLVAVCMARA